MSLFLVRHGQTAWNQQNLAIGQTDVPLSALGEKQVLALGKRFEGVQIDRIISSDLIRCQHTAKAISDVTGAPIFLEPRIRERSFGDWEGEDYASVNERLLKLAESKGIPFYEVGAPGGESHADIWERVAPVLEPLFGTNENIVLASHGGTSRVMLAYLLRATLATTFSFKFDNTAVTQLDRRPDGALLMSCYNDSSHLVGLVA